MSKIQDLLQGRDEKLDYDKLLAKHEWVIKHSQKCIISPDSDGFLCALFMNHHLDWEVSGFYDGKVMLLKNGIRAQDCIFLDMEVYRKNIRSIGQHMVQYNKQKRPSTWDNFASCIQPNNLRNYDGYNDFRLKYPLATIHLLVSILSYTKKIQLPKSATWPLLFVDGTYQNLFGYPENVLNWLEYLRVKEEWNPLKTVFLNNEHYIHLAMKSMDEFFKRRDEISIPKQRGDRLKISDTDGMPVNSSLKGGEVSLDENAVGRAKRFIQLLHDYTGWRFEDRDWAWDGLIQRKFTKGILGSKDARLNNKSFTALLDRLPVSWAMTAGTTVEYTLEEPDNIL